MPLFEVAVLEVPTQKEREEGALEKLVLAPVAVVAKDADTAKLLAVQQAKGPINPERSLVLVRPFVR